MAEKKSCPKLSPVDEKVLGLDYEKKFKLIEDEAKSLYAFCLTKGFSEKEIQECVNQLHGPEKPLMHKIIKDSYRSIFMLVFLIGVATAIFMSPKATNMVIVHLKLASIKTIPYWDWTTLYNEDCLIENKWLTKEDMVYDKSTCEYCSNVVKLGNNEIDRLHNTTQDEITTHYINNQQPVIVDDVMKDWTAKKTLTVDEIVKLYLYDPVLSTAVQNCNYTSDTKFTDTYYDFFNALNDKKLPEKFHAAWDNCEDKAGKSLRRYYTRPYFLPGMVQSSTHNTIMLSRGSYDGWFQLSEDATMSSLWVTVVEGGLEMLLKPYQECQEKFGCRDARIKLNAGDTAFFDDRAWEMEYRSSVDGVTIAIANHVVWDE